MKHSQEKITTSNNMVLILDFGSQVTQLIARRIRELGVFCEVKNFNTGGTTGADKNYAAGISGIESNLSNWAGPYVTNILGQGQAVAEDRSVLIGAIVLAYMVLFGHGLPNKVNPNIM